jgi:outer membrane protein
MRFPSRLLGLLLGAIPAGAAVAADAAYPPPAAAPGVASSRLYDIVLEVGAGGQIRPAYEGAKDYEFGPTGFVTLHQLWLPVFGQIKDGRPKQGWSFGPSFRYLSSRDSADHAQLTGLDDIDTAFEIGGKIAYTWGMWRPSLALRHGFGGHDGIVGEAQIEAVFFPTAQTELAIGPRASFASAEYMRTYFGVTPAESAASGLAAYDPGAGLKGLGFEVTGRYRFNPEWALASSLAYERLIGDAGDSPIVQTGDADQITARLGLTYTFGLRLFEN